MNTSEDGSFKPHARHRLSLAAEADPLSYRTQAPTAPSTQEPWSPDEVWLDEQVRAILHFTYPCGHGVAPTA